MARRLLRVFLAFLAPLYPMEAAAKLLPPIILPTVYVKVKSAHTVSRPGAYCPSAQKTTARQSESLPSPDPNTDVSNGIVRIPAGSQNQAGKSPALVGAPIFVSAIKTVTPWGRGWVSDNDQTVSLNADDSITWTDGEGGQTVFFHVGLATGATAAYSAPTTEFSTMTVLAIANGAPTSISDREADGTTRLFAVFDSTSVLRLSRLTDRNGNTVDFARDAQGRLTRVTDMHGRFFELTYNAAGLVSQLSDSGGRLSSYVYDSRSRRIRESAPNGATAYAYDTQDRLIKITYPNGGVRNYAYDSQNRVISEDDGGGNNAFSYSYGPNSTTIIDALGRKTVLEFVQQMGLKRLAKITDAAGNVSSFSYDSRFNLSSQTDALGHVTRYSHDSLGNVIEVQDAAGNATNASYDPAFSQPTSLTDALGNTANLSYDASGNLTQFEDPLSNASHFTYDSFGHVTQDQDPLGHAMQYGYDDLGALASVTDPNNRTTSLLNDLLARVTKNTDPAGHASNYQYDTASDMTQVTDEAGNITQYTYSPGRTGKLLTQVKDALNHTTTFGYDDLVRLTSVTNALGQTKTSQYDAKGNLIQTTNARGQVTTYTYDADDRLTKKSMVEGDITYTYDAAGNMLTAHHYNGSSLANTYDADNRLTQQIQTLPSGYSATLGYAYDPAGNRLRMTTPWGSFTYTYDAANRLTGITNPQNLTFTFAYDAAGRRTQLTYPNGIVTAYGYDAAGQLLSITATRASDQVIVSSIAYTYDAAGNRTSMTDWSGTHVYGYDNLNRLISATHPAASNLPVLNETFTYDAVGNRLADAQLTGYTYDVANRLQHNSGFSYSFDADGNLTVRTDSSTNQTSFGYDSANQQVSALTPQSANWVYSYDASGRRVARSSTTAAAEQFVYDLSGQMLAKLDSGNNPSFVYTSELRIGAPLFSSASSDQFFYLADALSSIIAHADNSGVVLDRIEYAAFGQSSITTTEGVALSGPISRDHRSYLGLEFDPEIRSHLFGARYFESSSGRFLSEDPEAHPGRVAFSYGLNNPFKFIDPLGTDILLVQEGWRDYFHQVVYIGDPEHGYTKFEFGPQNVGFVPELALPLDFDGHPFETDLAQRVQGDVLKTFPQTPKQDAYSILQARMFKNDPRWHIYNFYNRNCRIFAQTLYRQLTPSIGPK